ncbi:MAG: hypothetical protein IJT94_13575 [Oscillibacter sp.]|nr:hypothetical protein [Oscillibacter sp.]
METAIAIRDGIFWWVGCWAIFSALDAVLLLGWRELRVWREDRAERAWLKDLDEEERPYAEQIDAEREASDHEKQNRKVKRAVGISLEDAEHLLADEE